MRTWVTTGLVFVTLLTAHPTLAQTGRVTRAATASASQRDELSALIVRRWTNYLQEVYGLAADQWAAQMAPLFARVSLGTLRRALAAPRFDAMNDELLRDEAPRPAALDGASAPDAGRLGDAGTDVVFVPVAPCRIFDTRVAGGALAAGATRDFDVADVADYSTQGGASGNCNGVGAAGSFAAAVINFTVVAPDGPGYITAFPFGGSQPLTATVNYTVNDVRGNLSIVRLDQTAAVNELSVFSLAATHLVADITGYFIAPQSTPLDCTSTFISDGVPANGVFDLQIPSCPAGYTITGAGCRTLGFHDADWAINGLYRLSGQMVAFCSGTNLLSSVIDVEGTAQCCRVPGR